MRSCLPYRAEPANRRSAVGAFDTSVCALEALADGTGGLVESVILRELVRESKIV